MARGLAHDANAVRRQPENLRTRDLIGYITIYIYTHIYIYIHMYYCMILYDTLSEKEAIAICW